MMKQVTVMIPATTANLGPGFDCLGLALGLYNQLTMRQTDGGLSVTVRGEGANRIPDGESNLAVRAARRLSEAIGRPSPGWQIEQENHIPVASGLGSSAAAVLGGLVAANVLLEGDLDRAALLALATEMEGHPDNVAPALYGGCTLVIQDGSRLIVEPVPLPAMEVVVVLPDFDLPTAQARAALPQSVPLADAVFNTGRMGLLMRALAVGDYDLLAVATQDRLHQPHRLPLVPGLADAFAAARAAGAAAVTLSGAGPSLVAWTESDHQAIGSAAAEAFERAGLASRMWVLAAGGQGCFWQA